MGLNALRMTAGILASLFICGSVLAQVNWIKKSYFSNYGGLNDNIQATEIADNEATDIQNIVFDTGGAIKKRYGYDTLPDVTGPIYKAVEGPVTGICFYKQNDGDNYLFGVGNESGQSAGFYKKYDASGALPSGDWTSVTGTWPAGYDSDSLVTFSVASDTVIFTFSTSTPSKPFAWNATASIFTLSADSDLPTASLNSYHKNTLFLAGNTTNPSELYFSNLGNITVWTATDHLPVSTSDGTRIRALVSAYDSLYIFKDKSIWRLSGSDRDSFVLEKMVDGIGTLSQQSIAIVNNLIYFTTQQGDVAIYDGAYTVKFLSQKIRNTIGNLNFGRADNMLGMAFSTYKYVDNDYYVSCSGVGQAENDTVLLFDTAHNAWTKFDGINANAWTVAETSTGQYAMVFGDYDGYIHQYPSDEYHDGAVTTAAISAFYQTKWFRYADVALGDKYLRLLKTYVNSESSASNLNIEVKADYATYGSIYVVDTTQSGATWGSAIWGVDTWAGTYLITDRQETNLGEEMFQIKYSNEDVDEGFTVVGFETYVEPGGRI